MVEIYPSGASYQGEKVFDSNQLRVLKFIIPLLPPFSDKRFVEAAAASCNHAASLYKRTFTLYNPKRSISAGTPIIQTIAVSRDRESRSRGNRVSEKSQRLGSIISLMLDRRGF